MATKYRDRPAFATASSPEAHAADGDIGLTKFEYIVIHLAASRLDVSLESYQRVEAIDEVIDDATNLCERLEAIEMDRIRARRRERQQRRS